MMVRSRASNEGYVKVREYFTIQRRRPLPVATVKPGGMHDGQYWLVVGVAFRIYVNQ